MEPATAAGPTATPTATARGLATVWWPIWTTTTAAIWSAITATTASAIRPTTATLWWTAAPTATRSAARAAARPGSSRLLCSMGSLLSTVLSAASGCRCRRSTRSPARLLTSLGRILQTAGILLPIPAATARTTATTTTRSTRTAATRTPRGTTASGGTPRGTTRPVEVRKMATNSAAEEDPNFYPMVFSFNIMIVILLPL
mmetsp:Transcript_61424/g.97386  ORF Transcript_61424/g.97386 Transcript_61424/m.97386 type:complete len:201 (+) Transcript_61424:489-1091(+)